MCAQRGDGGGGGLRLSEGVNEETEIEREEGEGGEDCV